MCSFKKYVCYTHSVKGIILNGRNFAVNETESLGVVKDTRFGLQNEGTETTVDLRSQEVIRATKKNKAGQRDRDC